MSRWRWTIAEHVFAAFDLDHRQRTMCRYFGNRAETMKRRRIDLPTVECRIVEGLDAEGMEALIARRSQQADFILVDTPGRDDPLARHRQRHRTRW